MAIKKEAKRVKTGNSLVSYTNTIDSAVAQLAQSKAQLITLKANLNSDPDFNPSDANEVQDLIDYIATQVATI